MVQVRLVYTTQCNFKKSVCHVKNNESIILLRVERDIAQNVALLIYFVTRRNGYDSMSKQNYIR